MNRWPGVGRQPGGGKFRDDRQAIQVQIGGGLVRFPVQDVQRPVQVIDEDPPAPAGLLPEEIDPGQ